MVDIELCDSALVKIFLSLSDEDLEKIISQITPSLSQEGKEKLDPEKNPKQERVKFLATFLSLILDSIPKSELEEMF